MNVDISALLVALIGIAFGLYYALRFQKYLVHLVCALQLIGDVSYTKKVVNYLDTQRFLDSSRYKFPLLTYEQHTEAIAKSRHTIQAAISSEYKVVIREVLFQAVRVGIVPFIISVFFGEGIAFIGAMAVSIVLFGVYQIFLAHGPRFISQTQISIILRHIYSYAGYGAHRSLNSVDSSQYANSMAARITASIPQKHETPHAPVLVANHPDDTKLFETLSSVNASIASSEEYDDSLKLSWQRLWWGNDIALSIILIVVYWLTIAGSFNEYVFGALQIILFVQLFFIPVWAVITVTLKLLAKSTK